MRKLLRAILKFFGYGYSKPSPIPEIIHLSPLPVTPSALCHDWLTDSALIRKAEEKRAFRQRRNIGQVICGGWNASKRVF